MNFIKLFFMIIRVLINYNLDNIYNGWSTGPILMVIPRIGQILIGKITIVYKGLYEIAIHPNATKRTQAEIVNTKKTIMDNLQDGGEHYRVAAVVKKITSQEINSQVDLKNKELLAQNLDLPQAQTGDIVIFAKATHVQINPFTGVPNIPIDVYTNTDNLPKAKKLTARGGFRLI